MIVFGLLFGLFITYNILEQTNKDYDNKIQEMEYKLDVLESMISKSDTIIININKIKLIFVIFLQIYILLYQLLTQILDFI